MKIMSTGAGFFLCIGTGLGIGLFSGPGWGLYAILGAIIIAIANVVLKSEHYQDYVNNCKGKEIKVETSFLQKLIIRRSGKTRPNVILYISLSFLLNAIIIFVVAFITFFVKSLFLQN